MNYVQVALFSSLALLPLSAAVIDFNGDIPGTALPTSEWTTSAPTYGTRLSWITNYSLPSGGPLETGGAIGSYSDVPAGGASYFTTTTWLDFSHASVSGVEYQSLSVDLGIIDSYSLHPGTGGDTGIPAEYYVDRNTFGFSYSDGTNPLITVNLTPAVQSSNPGETTTQWNITYNFGQGAQTTTYHLVEGVLTTLSLVFFNEGIGLKLGNDYYFGTPVGYDPSTTDEGQLTFFSAIGNGADWGDNYMIFDNINQGTVVVPEASTALLGAVGALGLLRRRRA